MLQAVGVHLVALCMVTQLVVADFTVGMWRKRRVVPRARAQRRLARHGLARVRVAKWRELAVGHRWKRGLKSSGAGVHRRRRPGPRLATSQWDIRRCLCAKDGWVAFGRRQGEPRRRQSARELRAVGAGCSWSRSRRTSREFQHVELHVARSGRAYFHVLSPLSEALGVPSEVSRRFARLRRRAVSRRG